MSPLETTQDNPTKHVCHACIGDRFLANEVKQEGLRVSCSYCGETREVLTLEALARRIHETLQEHFELTPPYPNDFYEYFLEREGRWERTGESVENVLAQIANLSKEMTQDVINLLSAEHSYSAVKDGMDDPYGSDAMYEERGPDDRRFQNTWEAFSNEIRSHTRFFSSRAEGMLTDIFGDLGALKTYDGNPAIREVGPDDENRSVWRARTAQSSEELETILESPIRELGPPPSKLAKGGRMNAQGIPVFYGAFDEATCTAEVRPLVGSHVVVARFELLRPVRLLDLDVLQEIFVSTSYFDPTRAEHKNRAGFLRYLVHDISQPTMPQDEALQHLPTQAVTEYVANKVSPHLDGIIFQSSQTGGKGRNLVLFNHACGIESHDLPEGTCVEVLPLYGWDDPEDDDFLVLETVPSKPSEEYSDAEENGEQANPNRPSTKDEPEDSKDGTDLILRLDLESIVVLNIKSVTYTYNRRGVTRHRQAEEEGAAFGHDVVDIDSILYES